MSSEIPIMEKEAEDQPTPTQFPSTENGAHAKENDATPPAKKAPLPKRLWNSLGLNPTILIMMFKGAIAPTIALAVYQADSIAKIYSTLGYLVGIVSVLSLPILPRAKFDPF